MVTALVNIIDKNKRPIRCKTLLDTAATSNLITERLATSLNLPKQKCSLAVGGLGDIQTSTSFKITATIQSRYNNFEKTLEFFSVPEITKQHPVNYIDITKIPISNKIKQADPTFNIPSNIDLLIGVGPALSLIIPGQKDTSNPEGQDLFMQNTHFGWIIGGAISIQRKNNNSKPNPKMCHITTTQALQQLTKTWAMEEGPKQKHLSEEEMACEPHYKNHTKRNKDGSYVVALPFNSKKSLIGETRTRAMNRLKSLENKFKRNPEFAE
ncbi:uncharacterized protein LOC130677762 [Microplitis mediator]|uniref:uncharacterized protein LOC130677762 n=1 Tax=Microplitis mediator TaxID=375433 RepID=UPI002557687F|nr:uncharacterized protein LOC130677762 [Microplitis mediator]